MKLSKVQMGRIVIASGKRIGMIKGISNNVPDSADGSRRKIENVSIIVQWSDNMVHAIHPSNIEYFSD
jgi:hypothetical protein